MLLATEMAHMLLGQILKPGDWVVDATVGNGHDTRWLARRVGPSGRVFGFDVQATALVEARRRTHALPEIVLFHAGHERMAEHLPIAAKSRLTAVMFNLGFLPGADKAITTLPDTTLAALHQALDYLAVGGQISVVMYPGHDGGADEVTAVRSWAAQLPRAFTTSQTTRLNARSPAPGLLIVERNR